MSTAAGQLPLALTLAAHAHLDTFVAGASELAVKHVTELAAGRKDSVWLWGAPGSGKTHLLQAACRAGSLLGRRTMYVPCGRDDVLHPQLLAGLESVDLLALDDVDTIARDAAWQVPLFGVLNGRLGGAGALLMSAHVSPAAAGFALPDLASRAAGAVIYRLEPLADDHQIEALLVHARARGLQLDRAAAEYLHQRVARGMTELIARLERLDRASLAAQRKLTIPFIRDQLAAEAAARG